MRYNAENNVKISEALWLLLDVNNAAALKKKHDGKRHEKISNTTIK
jgi:hypothetical protein